VTVTSPNGAGTMFIGTVRNVTFNHNLGIGRTFNIDVSRDGGSNWSRLLVFSSTSSSSGLYAWTVDGPPATRVRVRVSDAINGSVFDISDVNFTISD
jgi:hypothetical protein